VGTRGVSGGNIDWRKLQRGDGLLTIVHCPTQTSGGVLPRRTAEILEEICQLAREQTPVGVLESAAFELARRSAEQGAKDAEHVRIVLQV
jgi:hypothetical protein